MVAILEPGDNARVEGDFVRVHYLVEARAGSHIARVRILVDGQEVLSQPGFEVASEDGVDRWLPVPLGPKAHRLAIIAEGEQGSSDPAAIRLQPSASEQGRKPNLWVLAAGVSAYTNQPNLKLNFAAQDAADFVAALKRQAHGPLYENVEAQLLRDGEVSAGTRWTAACSGWTERSSGATWRWSSSPATGPTTVTATSCSLPAEADVTTDAKLQRTGFPYSGLQEKLVPLANRAKVVAFLDACYSGTMKGAPPDPSKAVADLAAEENGVIVFASSGPKQLSEEYAPEHHGAFTAALLDGFAGAADYDHDRALAFTQLRRYVRDQVDAFTHHRQQPVAEAPEKRIGDPPLLVVR